VSGDRCNVFLGLRRFRLRQFGDQLIGQLGDLVFQFLFQRLGQAGEAGLGRHLRLGHLGGLFFGLEGPDGRLWLAAADKASTYSPAYEMYYENDIPVGTAAPLGLGWSFPVLFRTADSRCWGLITEANVGPDFCGSRLSSAAVQGVYRVALPNPAEGNGQGAAEPSATLPWEMPWRVIVLGDSLATIVESTLVTDLATPAGIKDVSWIRPGRVAWSWWSDNPSPQDGAKQRKFIDLAA